MHLTTPHDERTIKRIIRDEEAGYTPYVHLSLADRIDMKRSFDRLIDQAAEREIEERR